MSDDEANKREYEAMTALDDVIGTLWKFLPRRTK